MTDTPENNPISNDQIDPNHSKPLDVHTWSDHPKINKLVDELWFQVVEPALGGKSNNKGKSNPKRQLKVLLLDLYVAWLDDPNLCIGVNRNSNAYKVDTRYNALNSSIWDPMNNWFDNSVGRFQLNANTNETSAPVNANSLTSSRHPIVADIPRLTESTPSLSGILSRPLSLYDTIINARYVGDQEVFPAIQVKQFSSSRTVLVSHWNWYLFYQSSRDQLRNYVDQMFSNVIYWVNSNPNEDNIQINTSRTTYSVNESVQFNATLLNDSGQPENDASVEILIYEHNSMDAVLSSDDVLETQISTNNAPKDTFEGTELRSNIQLTPSGSGEYTGTIDINEEGIFSYDAIVRKNGTEVTRNSGQFIVQKSNDEFVVTSRNNSLLQRIATETDGFFVVYDEIELLRDSMQTTGLFESVDILVEEYFYPVQKVVWFFFVLILLGLEWFARKWYGLL